MKSGAGFSRRNFLKTVFWAGLALPFLHYCKSETKSLLLKITGTNHVLGHKLWAKNFPQPTEEIKTKYLVVGAGISGLSAVRYLQQNNAEDFLLLEMEHSLGGNSRNSQNRFSKFPLGAHYLPLPNKEDKELISFLEECGLITGYSEKGEPVFDDYHLTFPQEERLFFKNTWQSDLVPKNGITNETQKEIDRFFGLMDDFKKKKDSSGKFWFDIPVLQSSRDSEALQLEKITFGKWLQDNNFRSEELLWLLDYSCRDDYGLGLKFVSAWAGIHYFAGRKNNFSTQRDQVFTWPEGNSWLTQKLAKFSEGKSLKKHLAYDVKTTDNVEVYVYDDSNKISKKITAEKVLFATPQFVNRYIFQDRKVNNFQYVPWLLATLTLRNEFGGDAELAWDNVIYGTEGLGYIYDQHQNLSQNLGEKVITYYRSFSSADLKKERKKLLNAGEEELKKKVLDDLKTAHPEIENFLVEIQFHKLGHAMIAPVPNQIFGEETAKARKNINGKIFFAHTDLSGISIFEEAFHQGISAAKEMLRS